VGQTGGFSLRTTLRRGILLVKFRAENLKRERLCLKNAQRSYRWKKRRKSWRRSRSGILPRCPWKSRKRGSPLLGALSSKLPAKLGPNLHRRLVLGRPGQLPEFAKYRLPKRILIPCSAMLSRNLRRRACLRFCAAISIGRLPRRSSWLRTCRMSSSSNGIGGRSRAEKLCHRMQDLARAYIH
jgi:hypothetical protein